MIKSKRKNPTNDLQNTYIIVEKMDKRNSNIIEDENNRKFVSKYGFDH